MSNSGMLRCLLLAGLTLGMAGCPEPLWDHSFRGQVVEAADPRLGVYGCRLVLRPDPRNLSGYSRTGYGRREVVEFPVDDNGWFSVEFHGHEMAAHCSTLTFSAPGHETATATVEDLYENRSKRTVRLRALATPDAPRPSNQAPADTSR